MFLSFSFIVMITNNQRLLWCQEVIFFTRKSNLTPSNWLLTVKRIGEKLSYESLWILLLCSFVWCDDPKMMANSPKFSTSLTLDSFFFPLPFPCHPHLYISLRYNLDILTFGLRNSLFLSTGICLEIQLYFIWGIELFFGTKIDSWLSRDPDPNHDSLCFNFFECLRRSLLSLFSQNLHHNLPPGQKCSKVNHEFGNL